MSIEKGGFLGGKYEIVDKAGQGGAGDVFKVFDKRLQKVWAAKRVKKDCPGMEQLVLGRLMAGVFPRIVDLVETDEERYLIMDWIEGETLQKRLERDGPFFWKEVLNIGVVLCSAVKTLHSMQPPLLYLDCKPANIMMDQEGKLWLIDFGSTLESMEEAVVPVAGSPGYAAPEQMRIGAGPRADVRSDVYGIGRTLYALLSGLDLSKPPYGAHSLRQRNPDAPRQLERIVKRCMEEQPQRRFQTVEALKQALLECEEKEKKSRAFRTMSGLGTLIFLGLAVWRAGIFYQMVAGPAASHKEASRLLAGLVFWSLAAIFWRRYAVEGKGRGRIDREAEILQSVLRTEKKKGRWMFPGE